MIKFSKIILIFLITGMSSSCSRVLQTVDLKVTNEDGSLQQEFNVVEKTLTTIQAKKQNMTSYSRFVLQAGKGENARPIPESIAIQSNFPKNEILGYKIGINDTISFSRLIENNHSQVKIGNQWPEKTKSFNYRLGIGDTIALKLLREENTASQTTIPRSENNQNLIVNNSSDDPTITSNGRIGSDGSLLLLEVGRLEALGKTLNELRSEVRNILIRNGVSPRFQLEIVEFKSQRAYLTNNNSSIVVVLDDKKTTLRDILVSAKVGFKPGTIKRVRLQRDGKEYIMSIRNIFSEDAPEVTIKAIDHIFVEDSSANIITNFSTVGSDGNIVFAGVGKIKAAGLSLNQLRSKIAALINKLPDSKNAFQIEITKFASQTAIVNIPGKDGGVVPISDTLVALDEVLTENGLSIGGNNIIRISLNRRGETYFFTLDDLLKLTNQRVYLQPNDRVLTETLSYKENKVFIVGGVSPQIFKINPANRETLADVLFTSGGVLSASSARRSEVYLLRGSNPVVAFHLDAQSPTRLIVADQMELRPNDILYVAEQPIISFNRTLGTILPLRILLRDIQDENIP